MTPASHLHTDDWTLAMQHLRVCRGARQVLTDVELTIQAGECISIIGPNGAGKTTLILALLGLLRPAAGEIRLNNRDWLRLTPRARARFAAYVPQVLDVVPAFRVYDVIAHGRFAHLPPLAGLSPIDHALINRAIELTGITALTDRRLDTLSGGERRKVLIAAAIAQDPRLLVLDEPNTALDPAYQLELVRILRAWQQPGRTLLLISHDLQLPGALGGRVVALRDGRLAADGPATQMLTPATLGDVYQVTFGTVTTADGRQILLPDWWTRL